MKQRTVVWIGIVTFALGLILGRTALKSPSSMSVIDNGHNRRYALNLAFSGAEVWKDTKDVWERIGKTTPGVEVVYGGPLDGDPGKQIEEMDSLIAQKVSGIAVFSSDDKALAPTIDKAVSNGIPVVTLYADVRGSRRLTCVASTEEQSGEQIAKAVLKQRPELTNGNYDVIISIAHVGLKNHMERQQGIRNIMAPIVKDSDANQHIFLVSDEVNDKIGAEQIGAVLNSHPNVRAIFGCDPRSAIAAVSALKERGKEPGDVVVTGWDSDDDVLDLIKREFTKKDGTKAHWVNGTVVLYLAATTQLGFSLLEAYNQGYLYPEARHLREYGISPVPERITVPANIVDRHNVDAYLRKK